MENEQYKPIGKPASGTSQHLSRLIQDYEDKGIKVIVIGAGEPPRELLERAMMENSACVVVIEDIDLILKDKNLIAEQIPSFPLPPRPHIQPHRLACRNGQAAPVGGPSRHGSADTLALLPSVIPGSDCFPLFVLHG